MSQLYVTATCTQWESQDGLAAFMDSSENVMIAGKSMVNGTTTAVALQYHAKINWANQYAGTFSTFFSGMTQIGDGSYIAAGAYYNSSSSSDSNIWVVNIDANGNKTWEQQYSTPDSQSCASSVAPTSDGGFIVAGWVVAGSVMYSRILRFDASKNLKWEIQIADIACFSVAAASGNMYILSGRKPADGLNSNPVAVILDDTGSVKLNQVFSDYSLYVLGDTGAIQLADGNYAMAAKSLLLKFDASGNVIWANQTANGSFNSVAQLSNGNLVFGGSTIVSNVSSAYVAVTGPDGNTIEWDNSALETPSNFSAVFIDTGYDVVWAAGSTPYGAQNYAIAFAAFNPAKTLTGVSENLSATYTQQS